MIKRKLLLFVIILSCTILALQPNAIQIESNDSETCMQYFRKARKIINEQIKRERLHYPYRVATLYALFYDKFYLSLNDKSKEEVVKAATFVANRIKTLPERRQQQRYVSNCADAMNYIIESATINMPTNNNTSVD